MSLHKSLKRKDALARRRNVLSRGERIERLKDEERWDEEGASVFGLPKVKPRIVEAPSRAKAEEPEGPEGEEAERVAEAEADEAEE